MEINPLFRIFEGRLNEERGTMVDLAVIQGQFTSDALKVLGEEVTPALRQLDEEIFDKLPRNNARQGLSERTKETYQSIIRAYNQFLADRGLFVSLHSLKLYFEKIKDHLRANSLNVHKAALLKCIKAQMGENDIIKCLVIEKSFEQLPTYKVEKSVPRGEFLTEDEISKLIEVSPKKTRLIIHFLYKTACRVTEMINIQFKDCEPSNGYIKIWVIGKGKKERLVYIPTELYLAIIETFQGKNWLFESRGGKQLHRNNVGRQIKLAGKRIGKPSINPHMLRHVRATDMLLNKDVTLSAVSKYLGHANVAITASMYIHDEVNVHELFAKDRI